jgi:hypothetical protein
VEARAAANCVAALNAAQLQLGRHHDLHAIEVINSINFEHVGGVRGRNTLARAPTCEE